MSIRRRARRRRDIDRGQVERQIQIGGPVRDLGERLAQQHVGDAEDQLGPLCNPNEFLRPDHAEPRVVPSTERFEADRPAREQIVNRLELEEQFRFEVRMAQLLRDEA
ncbi:hypothetical protein HDG37_006581 [Paraburkholderia sp. MM5384-R2]|nr:hypothetical protein [Paraburkholderia sp. MM5384-R2]